MKKNKVTNIVGWSASILGSLMFSSYFHQAYLNTQGTKGSLLIPFFTILNCILWITYGIRTHQNNIITVNSIGLVGGVAVLTTGII